MRARVARTRAPRRASERPGAPGRPRAARPRPARAPRPASRRSRPPRAAAGARGRAARRARAGRARRGTRAPPPPGSRPRGARRSEEWPCRFESFFPSGPSTSPWWIDLRQLAAESARDALLHGQVRPVIRAADHVRDPERRGRRRRRRAGTSRFRPGGASVVPSRAQPHRAVLVALRAPGAERALGGLGIAARRARSAAPAPRRNGRRARRDRRGSPPPRPRRCASGSVSSIRRIGDAAVRVREAAVRDGRQRVSEVERARSGSVRSGREPARAYASIGT